MKKSDRFLK